MGLLGLQKKVFKPPIKAVYFLPKGKTCREWNFQASLLDKLLDLAPSICYLLANSLSQVDKAV